MTDTLTQDHWPTRALTPEQEKNRANAELIPFGAHGVSPQTFAGAVDLAKHMSTAKGFVGQHLLGNTGACLAVIDVAQQFGMSAYMVAKHTYFVNGVIAFDGQFVYAVINKFCPLGKRLRFEFFGEKGPKGTATRGIRVFGLMKDETEELEYESPAIKDIKVKNSPLWDEDQDLQLVYFGARRWQRKWWPEGLMQINNPDLGDVEIQHHVGADNAKDVTATGTALLDRLKNSQQQPGETLVEQGDAAGFNEANVHAELDQTQANGKEPEPDKTKGKRKKADAHATDAKAVNEPAAEQPPVEQAAAEKLEELPKPKNVKQWAAYCERWIQIGDGDLMKRWNTERKLRNDLGVTEDDRAPLFEKITERIAEIEGRDR